MGVAVQARHRDLVAAERMDLRRLRQNITVAWSRRASTADFVRQVALLYSDKLPTRLKPRQWTIRFRYPAPIGCVHLHLRSNNGADAFVHSEVFEHQYYRLPLRFAPATILDLGANIGLSAIYFARNYPGSRLACVEPVPENVRLLLRNLKDNAVEAEVIAAAVDAEDGVVAMERGRADYGHKIAAATPSAAWFDVASVSVPSILRRLGWARIGLLKIDIEGHESALLSDACEWLADVDALCVEYHHEFAEAELERLARQFGFLPPTRLPGEIWFLTRPDDFAAPKSVSC
jgi:FkbM family methyltransferase